jgi:ribonuclease HI
MPLDLAIKGKALKAFHRVGGPSNQDWDGVHKAKKRWVGHLKHWEQQCGHIYDEGQNMDIGCMDQAKRRYNINLSSFTGEKKYQKRSQYTIYTDGSKQDGKAGAGYQIYKGKNAIMDGSMRLPDWATVFQTELYAIEQACIRLANSDESVKYVKIFTDSQAAIRALKNDVQEQNSVSNANKALNSLRDRVCYLTVAWTRGHVGNEGNEKADELAKAGTLLEEVCAIDRPLCHLKESIEKELVKDWDSVWLRYKEGRMSKQFIKKYDKKKCKDAMSYGRGKLGTLIRIITGHNALGYFRNKIDSDVDPMCRFCQEGDETFWHMLTECPVFCREQLEFMGDNTEREEWDVPSILQFADITKIAKALEGYDEIWFDNDEIDSYSTQNQPQPEPD